MENLQTRKEELQGFIDSRKKQLAEGVSLSAQGVINSEIAAFETEIAAIDTQAEQEAAQNVRIQAQEVKVESITLPYDFNDLFDNKKANDMIIELVKEYQRKAYEDHNTEIQTLTGTHKEEIRASSERELQLKRQNDELQGENKAHHETNVQAAAQVSQLILDKQDADSKRDAAVKQLEEAQAEIVQLKGWNDDLRAQAAVGVRKAIDIIDISPSDKLALMVKETNEQKANRGLARWSEMMPEIVAPPVPAGLATFHTDQANISTHPVDQTQPIPIPADHTEVAGHTFQVHSGDAMDSGLQFKDGQGTETVTRQEFEALKGRVDQIERQAGIRVA